MSFFSSISNIFRPTNTPINATDTGAWSNIKSSLGDFASQLSNAVSDGLTRGVVINETPTGQTTTVYKSPGSPITNPVIPKPTDPIANQGAFRGTLPDLVRTSIIPIPRKEHKIERDTSAPSWYDKTIGSIFQTATATATGLFGNVATVARDNLIDRINAKIRDTSTGNRVIDTSQGPLVITRPQPKTPTPIYTIDKGNQQLPVVGNQISETVRISNTERFFQTTSPVNSNLSTPVMILIAGLIIVGMKK